MRKEKFFRIPCENILGGCFFRKKLQAGFAVSSRNFKKAADRNRIKRLMREAYRLQKNDLVKLLHDKEKGTAVFFLYTGKELPAYALMAEKINAALKKLFRLHNGNT